MSRTRCDAEGHCLKLRLLAAVLLVCGHTGQALSQSAPSQLTPPTLRPPQPRSGVSIGAPESAPLEVPLALANLEVTISRVEIKGAFAEVSAQLEQLARHARRRRFSIAKLYELAATVEQAHTAAGFVLARVVVPEQELVDGGPFKLHVIDGFIEAVETEALPDHFRSVVVARTATLLGQRHMTLAEIERRLLLAGDVPGARIKSILTRGRKPGGTRLVLDATFKPIQGSLFSENRLSSVLGFWQHTASVSVNGMLRLGDQVYGTLAGSDDFDAVLSGRSPLRMFGIGAVIPVGHDGLTFNPEYTLTLSQPWVGVGAFATADRFERLALRMNYPVIRSRSRNLNYQLAYEHIEQKSQALDFATDINRDQYGVVRAGAQTDVTTDWGGSLVLSGTLSTGLGGRSANEAGATGVPLSRADAGPYFQKLYAEAAYAQPVAGILRLQLSARGQQAFGDALLKPEQLSLDSPDVLSGWVSGSFVVDQGLAFRAELARPYDLGAQGWFKSAAPYIFTSTGHGLIYQPTALEQGSVVVSSYGAGMRGTVTVPGDHLAGSLNVEFARRFSDDPSKADGYRASLNVGLKF